MNLTPLFVADRPVSLDILSGINDYNGKFGILSHAFTTDNFKRKFNSFPLAKYKIGDSGIYQGKEISYERLFEEYVKMGVTHGIIKDYYRCPTRTFISAKEAIKIYQEFGYDKHFVLIGASRVNTIKEYLKSYEEQLSLGYTIVAIGGLLTKIQKHKRMVKVQKEDFLAEILKVIRNNHPKEKLFPLGAFNRSRIGMFKELDVWAADYKGWIFRYNIEQSRKNGDRFLQTQNYLRNEVFPLIEKNRLLILSCSQRKKNGSGPSLKVYDGQAFRVVRKYLKENDGLDIRIVSAKHGLINQSYEISYYDEKITEEKAKNFRMKYSREIKTLFSSYSDIMVFGSELYRLVLGKNVPQHTEGKIGEQLHQLKKWLYS